jgi:hypothetical protein
VSVNKGAGARALSADDIQAKFLANAMLRLDETRAQRAPHAIVDLQPRPVQSLMQALAGYSGAPAPTATHARSAFDTDSRLNFLAAAAMRVSAWANGMGG